MSNSEDEQRILGKMLDFLREELINSNIADVLKLYKRNYNKHRQKIVDCECDKRIIRCHTNVGKSCPTADTIVKSYELNGKQRQVTESIRYLLDSTICLRSETDLQFDVEEAKPQADEKDNFGLKNVSSEFICYESDVNNDKSNFEEIEKLDCCEPQKRRQVFDDCECDEQIINYRSNVDKPCPVAETVVKSYKINRKQKQVTENIQDLFDKTICLRSEADHETYDKEANHVNTFGRFFKLFDVYLISSSSNFSRGSRKIIPTIYERKQLKEIFECDEQTFEYHSKVDKPCLAAVTKVMSYQHNVRQKQVIESIPLLVDSTICLRSETKISEQAEEWEVSSNINAVIILPPNHYRSLNSVSYHPNTNSPWTIEAFILMICELTFLNEESNLWLVKTI
jgi:hypothetical protein